MENRYSINTALGEREAPSLNDSLLELVEDGGANRTNP